MRRGRFVWKLFLGNAALIALLWSACIWAILAEVDRFERPNMAPPGRSANADADENPSRDDDRLRRLVWTTGLAGLLAALGLTLGLTVLWSKRMGRLTAAAQALARGDFSVRLDASGADEVALLARSLNRMADRLSAQLATIDRQRRTLESLLGQLREGVVVARADGRVALINPAAARLMHVPVESAGINSPRDLSVEQCFPQHDLQRLLLSRPIREASDSLMNETRLELTTPDGPVVLLARASDIELPDADRTVYGRLLVLTDVTELARAVRLRSDFVANASHELRTPLSAIRAAAETLLKMNLAEEHSVAPRFVGVIARHVARLEALVADLLDLSRLESPGAALEATVLHLHRVMDELRSHWADAARDKGLQFECAVAPDCTTLTTNPRLFRLVLDNLLDNAMKFTDAGGHLWLRVRCFDKSVAVEVRDDGRGIPPEEHERVFERFYQVSPSRSSEGASAIERGTGLGLSIVKHAVAAMGGAVRLESELGKGTTVTVTVPIGNADAVANALGGESIDIS